MKKAMLFLFALVVAMGTNVQAQSLKKLYPADAEVVITPLPFAWEKCTPYLDPVVDFTWEKGKGLPLFSYRDLNGLLKNESEEDFAYVFRHFELPAEGVELLAVAVERSYFIRHLLLVYKDGVLTDWLEAGFCSNDNIAMKQWKVAADGTVEIYSLKVLGNRSVLFDDNFGSIRVQREDDTYQIDAKGKFKRLEKVKYGNHEYAKTDLQNKELNIWDM